jgi:hypothetical protein
VPLNTEIKRDGKVWNPTGGWDYFALSCMYTAACKEAIPEENFNEDTKWGELEDGKYVDFSMIPIYYLDWEVPLVKKGKQTLKQRHYFGNDNRNITLLPGDTLRAWRSHN